MGARGRRSAADMTSPRLQRELMPIDFEQFFARGGFPDRREAERALLRLERLGDARRVMQPDGSVEWYGVIE